MQVGEASPDNGTEPISSEYEYVDLEQYLDPEQYRIDLQTKQPVSRVIATRAARTINWATQRNLEYGTAEQQLGVLYDDIMAGLFGEAAKSSAWVQHITDVKAANPKQ